MADKNPAGIAEGHPPAIRKVKPAPSPPVVLGGGGHAATSPPTRTIIGAINYRYPEEFRGKPEERVWLAEMAAKRSFNESANAVQWDRQLAKMRITCTMLPALAFAQEAVRIGWDAQRIDDHMRDFVLRAAQWAGLNPDSMRDVWGDIEASPEWRRYELLLEQQDRESLVVDDSGVAHPTHSEPDQNGDSPPVLEGKATGTPDKPAEGTDHERLLSAVERNFGPGKEPYKAFYGRVTPAITNSEFFAWRKRDSHHCGRAKRKALDKAARALLQNSL